jgi:type VI secretion system protein ImpH
MYSCLSVKDALLTKPYEFEFAQAVHLLNSLFPAKQSAHTEFNLRTHFYFKSRVYVAAPPSDLSSIFLPPNLLKKSKTREPLAPLWYYPPRRTLLANFSDVKHPCVHSSQGAPIQVQVNFIGLAGIQGSLPLPYTEMLLKRIRQRDFVLRDFLDIFNNRFTSIFYRVLEKKHPTLSYASPAQSTHGQILTSLMGMRFAGPFFNISNSFLCYAVFYWRKPRTALGLETLLSRFFGHSVQVVQCMGLWRPISDGDLTYLKKRQSTLGKTMTLGKRAWCQDAGLRVVMTLPNPSILLTFLPGSLHYRTLRQIISFYVGVRYMHKICFRLKRLPQCVLGRKTNFPIRLGWTSWLCTHPKRSRIGGQVITVNQC